MKILIDPHVVMLPSQASPRDRILSYVEGIETWLNKSTYPPPVDAMYAVECVAALMQIGRFPFADKLAKMLLAHGVLHKDPQSLSRCAARLLDSFRPVDDYIWISIIVTELTAHPSAFADRLPQGISGPFLDCLAKIALQKRAGDPALTEFFIGSAAGDSVIGGQLAIRGTVTDVQAEKADMRLDPPPIEVNADLSVLFGLEDILEATSWGVMWAYPNWAIQKAYYAAIPSSERNIYKLRRCRIANSFLETIRQLGLHSQTARVKSIYQTCALVACGYAPQLPGINPRPLRGAIRQSDRAIGMRADISQRGPGYRLHYWQCPDRTVELSCVNVHNNPTIY